MVAPEQLGGLVDGSVERRALEPIEVETVVYGDAAAGDLQGAGLVVGDQKDRIAAAESPAGRDRHGGQHASLTGAAGGPDQAGEDPPEVAALSAGEHREQGLPLGGAQRGQRRGQRSGSGVALDRSIGQRLEGRRQASALESRRARCWSRATHLPPVPRPPRESKHGFERARALTGGTVAV